MLPSWERIEALISAEEKNRAVDGLERESSLALEISRRQRRIVWPYQHLVSALVVGISSGVVTVLFNYCVLVLLLRYQP